MRVQLAQKWRLSEVSRNPGWEEKVVTKDWSALQKLSMVISTLIKLSIIVIQVVSIDVETAPCVV